MNPCGFTRGTAITTGAASGRGALAAFVQPGPQHDQRTDQPSLPPGAVAAADPEVPRLGSRARRIPRPAGLAPLRNLGWHRLGPSGAAGVRRRGDVAVHGGRGLRHGAGPGGRPGGSRAAPDHREIAAARPGHTSVLTGGPGQGLTGDGTAEQVTDLPAHGPARHHAYGGPSESRQNPASSANSASRSMRPASPAARSAAPAPDTPTAPPPTAPLGTG